MHLTQPVCSIADQVPFDGSRVRDLHCLLRGPFGYGEQGRGRVGRTTVNRHVDALEAALGARLFLRHRRGYELTDIGREFLNVASQSHDLLDGFFDCVRVQGTDVTGEIIVTTLFPLTDLTLPGILDFRRRDPRTRVTVTTGHTLLRLEKAEVHVALRVGAT